jgi:hypothetical protein
LHQQSFLFLDILANPREEIPRSQRQPRPQHPPLDQLISQPLEVADLLDWPFLLLLLLPQLRLACASSAHSSSFFLFITFSASYPHPGLLVNKPIMSLIFAFFFRSSRKQLRRLLTFAQKIFNR